MQYADRYTYSTDMMDREMRNNRESHDLWVIRHYGIQSNQRGVSGSISVTRRLAVDFAGLHAPHNLRLQETSDRLSLNVITSKKQYLRGYRLQRMHQASIAHLQSVEVELTLQDRKAASQVRFEGSIAYSSRVPQFFTLVHAKYSSY